MERAERARVVYRATTNVISGNAPENDAAFAEIARLGVKTLISVDGSKPDVETARRHGLRYIHLPIGYDGVPTNRVVELTKAAQTAEGPFYVHCHHGLHRGPAAVATICQATAGWTTNQAVTWLRQAGTSPDYAGLYRSALEFKPPDVAALARVGELPEVTKTSSLVDAMVAVDSDFERLKALQSAGWSANPPALTPAQVATTFWKRLRELQRADATKTQPEDFHAKLAASEKAASALRSILQRTATSGPRLDADTAMRAITKRCADCHRRYRN